MRKQQKNMSQENKSNRASYRVVSPAILERPRRMPGKYDVVICPGYPIAPCGRTSSQQIMRFRFSEHKHGVCRLFSYMSAKVWTPSLRKVFLFCTSLCSGIQKKFSMWVYVTMDCLKGIYNGIGIRFFLMALIKVWTLIMYVLRRNLKKVSLCSSDVHDLPDEGGKRWKPVRIKLNVWCLCGRNACVSKLSDHANNQKLAALFRLS